MQVFLETLLPTVATTSKMLQFVKEFSALVYLPLVFKALKSNMTAPALTVPQTFANHVLDELLNI